MKCQFQKMGASHLKNWSAFANNQDIRAIKKYPGFPQHLSIADTPFCFKFCPTLPPSLLPSIPTPTALSVVLFLWLNEWSHLMCYFTYWYYGSTHWSVLCNKALLRSDTCGFLWYSDLISQTQTHTCTHTHNTIRG